MIVIKNSNLLFCDVDDTLVRWEPVNGGTNINITCNDHTNLFSVHVEHVKQLQEHIKRGHGVVVWSQGGWDWAEAVIKGFVNNELLTPAEVEEIVIMDKPSWIYDDLQADAWMPKARFLPLEGWGRE